MPPEHALVVSNIKKRFGDLAVLNGISLTAHKGDVISLLGSSGSGKSTLLRCINLLETPIIYPAGSNSGWRWQYRPHKDADQDVEDLPCLRLLKERRE